MNAIRNKKYPLRHLSIRVPWHDNGWNGTICKKPHFNESCLILPRIAAEKNNELEDKLKGKSIEDLKSGEYPCCIIERSTFMAPFSFSKEMMHPYSQYEIFKETHSHFDTTNLYFPPYSAVAVPFSWMLRKEAIEKADYYNLDFDIGKEPELKYETSWVQEFHNQKALLDCFYGHIELEESLCFFYAKRVPFFEGSGRVLIGVGRVKKISEPVEYKYKVEGGLRSMLWERMVIHSIRPDFKDGFILPYYEALEYSKIHKDFDPSEIIVTAPSDKILEFSYDTEHVSHDTAVRTLLECKKSLEIAIKKELPGDFKQYLKWIDERLNELEKLRGDYPGLGSALTAFGIETGHFVAREISEQTGEDDNPWFKVNEMFSKPNNILSDALVSQITPTLQKVWQSLDQERKELLYLISRFELTHQQAIMLYIQEEREQKYKIKCTDRQLLENPYLIAEITLKTEQPISIWTIDLGFFSSKKIKKDLLPIKYNITDRFDYRRIRGFATYLLESAAVNQGHTLLPQKDLIKKIRDLPLTVDCKISVDIINAVEKEISSVIKKINIKDGSPAYQLVRLNNIKDLIKNTIVKRLNGKRHNIEADWNKILDQKLGNFNPSDEDELNARKEKTAAIQEIANSRLSVLLGSAGTGKTTLLSVLCEIEEIRNGGILLLAPTGKARVRMSQATGHLKISAYTIAQFLGKYKRYDYRSQTYHLSDMPGCNSFETVIIDESSMLTEEMLAASFECLKTAKRIILAGDPQQLPPIGSGRPFVDIVNYLSLQNIENIFPKIGKSYAELIFARRQRTTIENEENIDRLDIQMAEWFRNKPIEPGQDSVWEDIVRSKSKFIEFIRWDTEDELKKKILEVLFKELKLNNFDDAKSFNILLGATYDSKGLYCYFNKGISKKVEDWQILSPVRGKAFGVTQINRLIHETFKKDTTKFAREKYKIPKPLGPEEIVYGDKVINLINNKRECYPEDGLGYIANGEIGIVVGQFKNSQMNFKGRPKYLKVDFSSQVGYEYTFIEGRDFKEDRETALELAYALTVHKAQGSEFKLVILLIPNPCFLLGRELLYTALTRQTDRIVILHQGDLNLLRDFSTDLYSAIAQRLTNIFIDPSPKEIKGRFLEERLINCASDGELLRSKSELIIYERLLQNGLNPIYEKELTLGDQTKIPDFTIEDPNTGITYYWEHCGMLNNIYYRKRWEEKKDWYFKNGILTEDEGEGENGVLIVTKEPENFGISIPEIEKIINTIIK